MRAPRGSGRRFARRPHALLAFAALAAALPSAARASAAVAQLASDAERAVAVATCGARLGPEEMPSAEELEAQGARIGEIFVHTDNIFDPNVPGEDFFLFRLANGLHIRTREQVIRRRLVFAPGSPFLARRLAESERLLRAEKYFYSVRIRPVAYCGGTVDVEVVTRDVWSLKLDIGFNRKGGTNAYHVDLQDSNLLGLGQELSVEYENTVDRSTTLASYRDEDFLARRLTLDLGYGQRSDGELETLLLARPFYSLDDRWSAGVRGFHDRHSVPRYLLGHELDRFQQDEDLVELSGGLSDGLVAGRAQRWRFGVTYDNDRFARLPADLLVRPLPSDRRLLYPWFAWETDADGYIATQNVDKIDRVEDLNVGRNANAYLGLAAHGAGSDRDAAPFGASFADGRDSPRGDLFLVSSALSGRLERTGLRNGLLSFETRIYRRTFGHQLFLALFHFDATHRLDPENQLLLGGDSGLRGYPLRYQEGNRRFLVTLEQRFFDPREYLHLLRVGAAVFCDVGRAWFSGEAGPPSLGTLRDVGVGLRLAPSRSAKAAMIHLDLAYPLDGRRDVRRVQWLVTTSETF